MTYSAFSESKANSFGEKFSHYKTAWCTKGTNVKFVIGTQNKDQIAAQICLDNNMAC